MITVAIVDDHSVFRFGLRYLFGKCPDISLVAEGASAAEAIAIAKEKKPDVLMLDVRMPEQDGVSAISACMEANPGQRILMLTTSDTEEDIFKSVKLGAKGYVLKEMDSTVLMDAIRAVARGETYFPAEIQRLYDMRASEKSLSPRELEGLKAIGNGMTNPDIARAFGISPNSVKKHVRGIFDKLGVADRSEAVSESIRRGIIQR